MSNTVVGIFENEGDARDAQQYLLESGFSDEDVDIKTAKYKSEDGELPVDHSDDGVFERIGNFFKDLFGGDEEEAERYSEAGRRGTIVTVHSIDPDQAELASKILDNHGAVDVNENFRNYTSEQSYSDSPRTDRLDLDEQPVIDEEGRAESELRAERLRSRIVARSVEKNYRLRQEQFNFDRTPINSTGPDHQAFTEKNIVTNADDEDVELNKTIAERDNALNDIIHNPRI
ncbi:hypothetical protein [Dyadobacter sp. CY323]|uniref:hypothetical protein n=1 Tax=Dyadobacter sp. CY323 TaxID=2907302 RepID=UPI001F356FAA|nr:hypothetical protein [Dyadobacter sp. CY323]MCE6991902.1 hypothetical protein [Dyadobacter sp. CY323]